MQRVKTAAVVLACALFSHAGVAAGEVSAPPDTGRKLVLLVQYLGSDYPRAVQDGRVINPSEYDEALQNLRDVGEMYAQVRPQGAQQVAITRLSGLVANKAPGVEVEAQASALVAALTADLDVTPFPASIPDLARGKQIYAQNCATCHGAAGGGDGPAATSMKPEPTALSGAEWADKVAPFQIFNTVTLGLPGTAMTSFQLPLSEEDRWNVAFYVLTLRPSLTRAAGPQRILVSELAAASNLLLTQRLTAREPTLSKDAAAGMVDAARRTMPLPPTAERAMDVMANAARESVGLARAGQRQEAAELVSNAYFDVVEPAEKELRELSADQVNKLEAAVTALRKTIKDGGNVEAAAQDVQRQTEVFRRLLAARSTSSAGPPWGAIAGIGCAMVALLAGIFLMARKSRRVGE